MDFWGASWDHWLSCARLTNWTVLVADGFAVSWSLLISNVLLTFAYVLPFSIAGYFILKNREVAA